MKKAIITGATGFIGSALVRNLLKNNVDVLALGRKFLTEIDFNLFQDRKNLTYLKLDMADISSLPSLLKKINWLPGDSCVFYNFAWGGSTKLSDMDVNKQLNNAVFSELALKSAKQINCKKFIHVGTMEEVFTYEYLKLDHKTNNKYNRHIIYAAAKTVSRNILKLIAYQLGMDLTIVSNSHVMGINDNKDSFLQVTLEKLIKGDDLIFSTGEQMFDVISVDDCAEAYRLIGEKGKAHEEYWVGSGHARKLKEYVEIMAAIYPSGKSLKFGEMPYNDISLKKEDFSIEKLIKDTGFRPKQQFNEIVKELHSWLIKQ